MSILLAATAAAVLSCPAPGSGVLIGRWESRAISKGGIGSVIDLRADGTFVQALSVLVDSRYAVEGDKLITRETAGEPPSKSTAMPFHIHDDTLTRGADEGPTIEAKRVGSSENAAPPIVGVWRYRHPAGAIAYDRFTEDGRYLLRIPMTSEKACYSVDAVAGKLTVVDAKEELELTYSLADKQLQLAGEQGAQTYTRGEFGGWYDIDSIDYEQPKKRDQEGTGDRATSRSSQACPPPASRDNCNEQSEHAWDPPKSFITRQLQRFYDLDQLIRDARAAKNAATAESLAREYIALADVYRCNWHYGDAIHDGNRTLGLILLENGDVEGAAAALVKAGASPGSPGLKSFGPDFDLANLLLRKGRSSAVAAYLRSVDCFWEMGDGIVDRWLDEIGKGKTPELSSFADEAPPADAAPINPPAAPAPGH